jgi:hypothetical protein
MRTRPAAAEDIMDWIRPLALIIAGILAASGFIISKQPKAKELIDKIVPYQGFIGVGLLVWGVIDVIRLVPHLDVISKLPAFFAISIYAAVACEILLGFLLGMPVIAQWIPGESPAEQKAMEMQQKVLPYQVLIGGAGIVVAVLLIYYQAK